MALRIFGTISGTQREKNIGKTVEITFDGISDIIQACMLGRSLGKYVVKERKIEMAEKKNLLTREGLRKLEDELQDLKVNRRQEIAQKIKEAREQGDLSENAEYDAAKDEQRDIEARIEEIEKILKYAEVADEEEVEQGVVNFGSEVSILDIDMDEVNTFKIVGSTESNILEGKLSNESPLGMAILKKRVGETVTVEAPDGNFDFRILDIR